MRILGVRAGTPDDEVRAAYRDLVKVWHPDRFDHDPELRERAERKLQEINEAWETLKSCGPDPGPTAGRPRPSARSTTWSPPPPVRTRRRFPWLRLVTLVIPVVAIALVLSWTTRRFDRIWSEVAGNMPVATDGSSPASPTEQAIREVVSALSERRFVQAGIVDVKRRPSDDAEAVGRMSLEEVVVTDDEVFGWHRLVSVATPTETVGWARLPDLDTLEEIGLVDPRVRVEVAPPPAPYLETRGEEQPVVRNVEPGGSDLAGGFVRHGSSSTTESPSTAPTRARRRLERMCAASHYPATQAYRDCLDAAETRWTEASLALVGIDGGERRAIESACMTIVDPVAFSACLRDRLRVRNATSDRLAALPPTEREALRLACGSRLVTDPVGYESCVDEQIGKLDGTVPLPDLTSLGATERAALDAACAVSLGRGPAAYRRCVRQQLAHGLRAPRRPDLASLDAGSREAVEAACSLDYHRGAEAYNACLWKEYRAVASR